MTNLCEIESQLDNDEAGYSDVKKAIKALEDAVRKAMKGCEIDGVDASYQEFLDGLSDNVSDLDFAISNDFEPFRTEIAADYEYQVMGDFNSAIGRV